jgi:hypothetical protein
VEALLVLFVVFGGPGLVVGGLDGYVLGTTPMRRIAVMLAGVPLVVAATLASIFSKDPNTCHDCREFYGGALDIFTVVFFVGNALCWALGTLLGARRATTA